MRITLGFWLPTGQFCKEPQASALMPNTDTGPTGPKRAQKPTSGHQSLVCCDVKRVPHGLIQFPVQFTIYIKLPAIPPHPPTPLRPAPPYKNKKQPSDVDFSAGQKKVKGKNRKHFEYYHNEGWIPAGAALVLVSSLLDSEKGLNNRTIRYNCCYVWPKGMNQIMEENDLGSSSPEAMHPSRARLSKLHCE